MDLITSFANEFNIPIIRKDQKIWFFRTRGGKFYYDFINNKGYGTGKHLEAIKEYGIIEKFHRITFLKGLLK